MKKEQAHLLDRVPVLICYQRDLETSARQGAILFYHGLGASKETHLEEIERLASTGFLVVAVDAVGHGQREDAGSTAHGCPTRSESLLNVVRRSALEIPELLDELLARYRVERNRIGITGISMGGYICFFAITLDHRFKVAATILGSPEWNQASVASPHRHLERFSSIKLLSQNAGMDEVVPAREAQQFHARLRRAYDDYDHRFEYIEYPDSGHFMEADDWNRCIDKTVAWFNRHLSQPMGLGL